MLQLLLYHCLQHKLVIHNLFQKYLFLRVVFPNANHMLHNGGSATIIVPTHRSQCIVIPQEATYELQNRTFVYRVIDGKTKATPVTLFPQNNGKEYIVEEGLSAGETIIAEGAGLLKEGIEVKK